MFNSCICGSSLHHGDEDDDYYSDPQSTPKRSKKANNNNNNKSNPYADRGLDKFSALLAQIETQKQKIYAQVGADEVSIVRFFFSPSSDSNDVIKPIVVKLKGVNKFNNNNNNNNNKESGTAVLARSSGAQSEEDRKNDKDDGRTGAAVKDGRKEKLKKSVSWKKMKWEELRKPRYYVPFTVVMILVFLAIYGRAFAILCTSVGWYAIPAAAKEKRPAATTTVKIRNNNNNNKEYVRRFSEKSLIKRSGDDGSPSPKSGGLTASTGHRHRRKSSP